MIRIHLPQKALDLAGEMAAINALGSGAVASFTGTARADDHAGQTVTAIELEHYPAMTSAALQALAETAMQRWPLAACCIIHRTGIIPVGDAIVLVDAASSHRVAALESCSFLIDRLKTDAPFWKKEYYDNGSARWVEAKAADTTRAQDWNIRA